MKTSEKIYDTATYVGKLWDVCQGMKTPQNVLRSAHWGEFVANVVWINVRFTRVAGSDAAQNETLARFRQEEQNNLKRGGGALSYLAEDETRMLFHLKQLSTDKERAQALFDYLSKRKQLEAFEARLSQIRDAYVKEKELLFKILFPCEPGYAH